ncbi:MAG: hypothetical protein KR126chlam5_00607 [Candidatus Anoxychlamydiales bacterium]|nr:hypothetical protein [Candidatus Anoxychlamydiales bacterium]
MKWLIINIGFASCFLFLSHLASQESESGQRRYLDYFASHLRKTQHTLNGQDNHATVVAFEGELNKECLIESLKSLFQVHANLRVKKIEYDDQEKRFFCDGELGFSDISCEFIEIDKEDDWRKVMSEELFHPFPSDGPYWKIRCLTVKNSQPSRHYLIQFFDHSLSDGISTAKLNDELFSNYHSKMSQEKMEVVKDCLPGPAATLFPPEKQCNWQDYKNKLDQIASLYPMPPKGLIYEKQATLQQRKTQAVLFAFELDPLYQTCKEHGLTVNDMLSAISLLALRNSQANRHHSLDTSIITCVNLRNSNFGLSDKINANCLGCFFNIIIQPQKIDASSTLWTLAENYRKHSAKLIQQLARPPINFSIEEMCERNGLNLAERRNHFALGIATSNLGKIDLKKKYGDIDIVFYQFFTNQGAGFFEAILDVSCVENTVFCNITYVEPLHSREWALQFVLHFIRELKFALHDRLTLVEYGTDKDILEAERHH